MSPTNADLPQMTSSHYMGNSALDMGNVGWASTVGDTASPFQQIQINNPPVPDRQEIEELINQLQIDPTKEIEEMADTSRRLVQVIIVDPHKRVPLDDCILYHGQPIMTDLDDQELFFSINIMDLLKKHNTKRVKWKTKPTSGKGVALEPARIRDLAMNIIVMAEF